jgi:hypothetical protein
MGRWESLLARWLHKHYIEDVSEGRESHQSTVETRSQEMPRFATIQLREGDDGRRIHATEHGCGQESVWVAAGKTRRASPILDLFFFS